MCGATPWLGPSLNMRCTEGWLVGSRWRRSVHAGTSLMMILPFSWTVWLLTMLTMATPRLHRIPKEMQKPRPLSIAMMYLRGSPQQVQSSRGGFFSCLVLGLPSSVSSIASPVCCRFSSLLQDKPQRNPRLF